jgi:hypothetical protein
MSRRLISSGSPFENRTGCSRAAADGDGVLGSGTFRFDNATMTIAEDVVGTTCVRPNGGDFERCWPALREAIGSVRPAATMLSTGLADPWMKIEVDASARKPS